MNKTLSMLEKVMMAIAMLFIPIFLPECWFR